MLHKTNSLGSTFKDVLGGLSIIIFLSSPSIAGYTTASAKNRANQILNSASVRAIVVSAQIQKGSETPTLGGFTDDAIGGATFESVVKNTAGTDDWNKATDKRFSLALTGLDEKVCTQMKASVGDNSIIRNIADDCTTITYNNDLSTTDLSPNDPTPSGPKGDECTDTCSGGATCENGYCQCAEGRIWNPKGDNKLGEGRCVGGIKGCTKNQDCLSEEYCSIHRGYNDNDTAPDYGTCKDKGNLIFVEFNNHIFYFGTQQVSWWGARNFCLAHGKKLSRLESLGLTKDYRYTGQEGPLYLSFNPVGAEDKRFWTGNTISEASAHVLRIGIKEESCSSRARSLALSTYPLCE